MRKNQVKADLRSPGGGRQMHEMHSGGPRLLLGRSVEERGAKGRSDEGEAGETGPPSVARCVKRSINRTRVANKVPSIAPKARVVEEAVEPEAGPSRSPERPRKEAKGKARAVEGREVHDVDATPEEWQTRYCILSEMRLKKRVEYEVLVDELDALDKKLAEYEA